jgi:hypothetical protein
MISVSKFLAGYFLQRQLSPPQKTKAGGELMMMKLMEN